MTTGPAPARTARIAPEGLERWRRRLFLVMVFLLPLHTVSVRLWVAWRPFMVLLLVIAALDALSGWRTRTWPWHPQVSAALAVFVVLSAASWPGPDYAARFARLLLALAVGGGVLLVVERGLRRPGAGAEVLRTVFWSGAAMAVTGIVLSFVATGSLGRGAIDALDDLPLVERLFKPAYIGQGFLAVTNWHPDPGYAAAWTNLWAALGLVAGLAGYGSGRRWIDAGVLGGLFFATVTTVSRTGWAVLAVGMSVTAVVLLKKAWVDRTELIVRLGGAVLAALGLFAVLWATDPEGIGADVIRQIEFRLDQGASLETVEGAGFDTEGAVDVRGTVWPRYVEAFTDNPLRGIGLGTGWATPGMQEPHNLGLQLLGETGLLGLAGFLGLAAVLLLRGGGAVGGIALVMALLPAVTQTVLFEPTWWFAAGLYLAGRESTDPGSPRFRSEEI